MRTEYRIDAYQQSYFVIDSFEDLFEACYDTDFAPIYRRHAGQPAIAPDVTVCLGTSLLRYPVSCGCAARDAAAGERDKKIGASPGSGHDAPNNAVQVA